MTTLVNGIPLWIILAVLWTIPWKGVALWKSARLSHKKWFIALLLVNSLGLLEMYYIFVISRGYTIETIEK